MRALRISAADELIPAWAAALFGIDTAINTLTEDGDGLDVKIREARELVTLAVKSSVRVDLLFVTTSHTSGNSTAVMTDARQAIAALEERDAETARQHHLKASLSQAWLVNTADEAIQSTGTRRDVARTYKTVLRIPELDPQACPK